MRFVVNGSPKSLTVAEIARDGNCTFAAAVHQQFRYSLNSKEHKDATKKLRADVIAHILDAENFPLFLHSLKGRINATKNKNEFEEIEVECKMFVRHILARNRCWAGTETLFAISDLFQTNVIVFTENAGCKNYKRSGKKYDRSIAVAYRCGGSDENGQPVYNHYDSVCDMDSDDIYAAAESIV